MLWGRRNSQYRGLKKRNDYTCVDNGSSLPTCLVNKSIPLPANHPSMHTTIYPSTHPPLHYLIHLPSINSRIHHFTYQSIILYRLINLPITHSFIPSFIQAMLPLPCALIQQFTLLIQQSVDQFTDLFTQLSAHLPTHYHQFTHPPPLLN